MTEIENEGLLSRWSRRKLEARENLHADKKLPEEAPQADLAEAIPSNDVKEPEPVEDVVLTDDDMPPIESLKEGSDISMFMSPGVSDKLRNLALRKMFHVPSFNIRDGLDEYDEDYTFFEPLGDIVTCDMKHQMEMLEKKKLEEAEALVEEDVEDEAEEDGAEEDEAPPSGADTQLNQRDDESCADKTAEDAVINEVKGDE